MRGSPCPEAWVCPVPEPVGLKVWANPHQSQLSCSRRAGWKRGRTAQNSPFFRRESLQSRGVQERALEETNIAKQLQLVSGFDLRVLGIIERLFHHRRPVPYAK
jgi:hypothetical protein